MTREEAKEKIIGAIWFAHGEGWGKNDEEVAELEQSVISIFEQQPCEDAISREKALNIACQCGKWAYDRINELPSVTQKSGKWIYEEVTRYEEDGDTVKSYADKKCKCSACGHDYGYQRMKDPFCRYCGAKMESEEV